jgi:chromosome segregation ATPase
VKSFLSSCRNVLRLPLIPRRIDRAEQALKELANELQGIHAIEMELANQLQAMHDTEMELANELRRLSRGQQAVTDALGTLTPAVYAAEADRRTLGERIESAAARTDEVARASAKALGIGLTTFVDAQKQILALILEKDFDKRTSSGGLPTASGSTEAT